MLKIKGNQIDAQPVSGGQNKTVHIRDVKVILLVDRVIKAIPDYTNFGRKSKLDLDPDNIPDLNPVLSTRVHTHTTPTATVSMPSQTAISTQAGLPVSSKIASKLLLCGIFENQKVGVKLYL